jgi:DNA-binding MarR family transcriptional regulator
MSVQADTRLNRSQADAARLALALRRVSRWIRRQHTLPLGHGAISALATISAEGPLRLGDLAAREGVAPASLSRIIAALVGDGYVARHADPIDGRSWQVTTTPHGEQLLAELRARTAVLILDRLDRLEADQRAALIAALPALEAIAAEPADGCAKPIADMLV